MVKVSLSSTRIRRLKSEALVFDLRVDGKLLRTNIWAKKDGKNGITFRDIVVATPAGPFRKPFLFSEIMIRKSDSDLGKHALTNLCCIGNGHPDTADIPERNLDRIGTILVRIFRVAVGRRTRTNNRDVIEG